LFPYDQQFTDVDVDVELGGREPSQQCCRVPQRLGVAEQGYVGQVAGACAAGEVQERQQFAPQGAELGSWTGSV